MSKKLLIIGAGGFGREILSYARDIKQEEWTIEGYLDDDINALDGMETGGFGVVGKISNHVVSSENVYVCSIADCLTREKICNSFLERGANFINLIHPTARLPYNYKIGKGLILAPFSCISENVISGDFVILNAYTGVGHNSIIGNFVTLSSHCDITGNVCLKDHVFLGSSAVICPGVTVGENARVGAGSIVLKKVKANTTVFGNPARTIF